MSINIEQLKEKLNKIEPKIQIYKIDHSNIIFEENVKLNCFYCSKYNNSWMCPPKIPQLDYYKIINEYSNIVVYQLQ